MLKEHSNIHTQLKIDQGKLEETEIDPLFCKAYGVQYNPDRAREIYFSSNKAEELDFEYSEYLERRYEDKQAQNGE